MAARAPAAVCVRRPADPCRPPAPLAPPLRKGQMSCLLARLLLTALAAAHAPGEPLPLPEVLRIFDKMNDTYSLIKSAEMEGMTADGPYGSATDGVMSWHKVNYRETGGRLM